MLPKLRPNKNNMLRYLIVTIRLKMLKFLMEEAGLKPPKDFINWLSIYVKYRTWKKKEINKMIAYLRTKGYK